MQAHLTHQRLLPQHLVATRPGLGDLQQGDVGARPQRVVQVLAVRTVGRAAGVDRQSGGGGGGESLQEFAPLHDSIVAGPRGAGQARRCSELTG